MDGDEGSIGSTEMEVVRLVVRRKNGGAVEVEGKKKGLLAVTSVLRGR